jgi:O-antigen/teichoic acid export membrane protein
MALLAGSIGIASVAIFRLSLNGMRAIGRPVGSQAFETIASFGFAAVLAGIWLAAATVTAAGAVLIYFACQIAVTAAMALIIGRRARDWGPAIRPDPGRLRASGWPVMGIQTLQVFQDWLLFALVGALASAAEVGALRVAMQVVLAMTLVVVTGETFIAARVAGDLRIGRPDLVWQRHRRATIAMALALGPLILGCVLFPTALMELLFGAEFAIAGPALGIMAAGQASRMVTGPIGGLLMMAGHERVSLLINIAGLVLLVGLALWLVPVLGLEGAAIAHAAAVAFRNFASFGAAWRLIPKQARTGP